MTGVDWARGGLTGADWRMSNATPPIPRGHLNRDCSDKKKEEPPKEAAVLELVDGDDLGAQLTGFFGFCMEGETGEGEGAEGVANTTFPYSLPTSAALAVTHSLLRNGRAPASHACSTDCCDAACRGWPAPRRRIGSSTGSGDPEDRRSDASPAQPNLPARPPTPPTPTSSNSEPTAQQQPITEPASATTAAATVEPTDSVSTSSVAPPRGTRGEHRLRPQRSSNSTVIPGCFICACQQGAAVDAAAGGKGDDAELPPAHP